MIALLDAIASSVRYETLGFEKRDRSHLFQTELEDFLVTDTGRYYRCTRADIGQRKEDSVQMCRCSEDKLFSSSVWLVCVVLRLQDCLCLHIFWSFYIPLLSDAEVMSTFVSANVLRVVNQSPDLLTLTLTPSSSILRGSQPPWKRPSAAHVRPSVPAGGREVLAGKRALRYVRDTTADVAIAIIDFPLSMTWTNVRNMQTVRIENLW